MNKSTFFGQNLLKGVGSFILLLAAYLILKHQLRDLNAIIDSLLGGPLSAYLIFTFSEIFFGLLPPEVFMIWALRGETLMYYAQHVFYLSIVSYVAGGIIGYLIGYSLNRTVFFRFYRRKFLMKLEEKFLEYGGFLVIVAALTPLPFSAICMVSGSYKFPFYRFLIFALARFFRFWIYAMVIWNTKGL